MRVAFVVMLGLAAMPAAADEYLKSVSPKSSIDGYMAVCRQDGPDAWCRCQVRKMVQSREGDFLVDAIATGRRMDNIQKSVGMERVRTLAERHGLEIGEARSILDGGKAFIREVGRSCA